MLIAMGFGHVLNAISKVNPNLRFWNCVDKKSLSCPGLVHEENGFYTVRTEHNHDSATQEAMLNAAKAKKNIRAAAKLCGDDVSALINR